MHILVPSAGVHDAMNTYGARSLPYAWSLGQQKPNEKVSEKQARDINLSSVTKGSKVSAQYQMHFIRTFQVFPKFYGPHSIWLIMRMLAIVGRCSLQSKLCCRVTMFQSLVFAEQKRWGVL